MRQVSLNNVPVCGGDLIESFYQQKVGHDIKGPSTLAT